MEHAYAVLQPKQSLMNRMFPHRHCELPEAPFDSRDVLFCNVVTRLSWLDRVRVLISGTLVVKSVIVTENEVGDSKAASVCFAAWKV
jgi:hypothetical protein